MKKRYIILIIVILLVGLRIWLPTLIKNEVVSAINAEENYECTLADIDLALYRGAVCADSLRIYKTDNEVKEPFVSFNILEASIDWEAIWDGKIVAKIDLHEPSMYFKDSDSESGMQTGGTSWTEPILDLIPFKINEFLIHDGKVHFEKPDASPPVDLALTDVQASITNITNSQKLEKTLPSDVDISATVFESGSLSIDGQMNLIQEIPDADLALRIDQVQLPELRDFTIEYGKFDFERGIFTMTGEAAIKDSKLAGYIKPFFNNVKVLAVDEKEDGFFSKVWEAVVGGVFELTENQSKDETATKVEIEGNLDNPEVHPLDIILNTFQNAFIDAFQKEVDNTIDLSDVNGSDKDKDEDQNFIQELFDGDGKLIENDK